MFSLSKDKSMTKDNRKGVNCKELACYCLSVYNLLARLISATMTKNKYGWIYKDPASIVTKMVTKLWIIQPDTSHLDERTKGSEISQVSQASQTAIMRINSSQNCGCVTYFFLMTPFQGRAVDAAFLWC